MSRELTGVRSAIAYLALLCAAASCDEAPAAGTVGASCARDADCRDGLSCLSQICVSAPAGTAGSGDSAGGSSGGSAGSSGGAGSSGSAGVAGHGCDATNTVLAPQSGLIADFADPDGGIEIMGGLFEYGAGAAQLNAPSASIEGGTLHITQNAAATASPQYLGVFLYFNQCVDASAFSGVKFSISGSFTGCSMQFFSTDVAHQDATTGADLATGPAGSYPPQYGLAASQVTSTPQTIQVPFTGQAGGSPPTPVDGATLIAEVWQFNVPAAAVSSDAGAPSCVADLTIDDLTFF